MMMIVDILDSLRFWNKIIARSIHRSIIFLPHFIHQMRYFFCFLFIVDVRFDLFIDVVLRFDFDLIVVDNFTHLVEI